MDLSAPTSASAQLQKSGAALRSEGESGSLVAVQKGFSDVDLS